MSKKQPTGLSQHLQGHEKRREEAQRLLREKRASRTLAELKNQNAVLAKALEDATTKLDTVLTVIEDSSDYVLPAPKTLRSKKGNPSTVSVTLCSDLHVEERVEGHRISYLNEHNLEISEEKLHRFWRNQVSLIKMMQAKADVQTHVLWLGGDLFTGHIHEELVETTELTPSQAILWLRKRIMAGIKYLRAELDVPRIIVPCTYGNHGRSTHKMRIATAADHSWEWLMYQIMREDLEEQKLDGVEMIVPSGDIFYLHLLPDYAVRFLHGHQITYRGGTGGLHIPLNKRVEKWDRAKRANVTCFGHYHTKIDLEYAVGNGSLIGFNAFAESLGFAPEPAQQVMFFVDLERKQKTGTFPIHVT